MKAAFASRASCAGRAKLPPARRATASRASRNWLPTLLELAGAKDTTPAGLDGISFAPTLLGRSQPPRPFLYRESPGYGGQQCVRVGDWKAFRRNLLRRGTPRAGQPKNARPGPIELYNLATDPGETRDVAAEHPGHRRKTWCPDEEGTREVRVVADRGLGSGTVTQIINSAQFYRWRILVRLATARDCLVGFPDWAIVAGIAIVVLQLSAAASVARAGTTPLVLDRAVNLDVFSKDGKTKIRYRGQAG